MAGARLQTLVCCAQLVQIERPVRFRQGDWPPVERPIPGELDAVLIGIPDVDGVGDAATVGCRLDRQARIEDRAHDLSEIAAIAVPHGKMVQAERGRRRQSVSTCPRVQSEMMVVAAEREKHGSVHLLPHLEAEQTIEADRPLEVSHPQVDVPDIGHDLIEPGDSVRLPTVARADALE